MNADPSPDRLRIVSFALHSARGLVRDRRTRRNAMFVVLAAAVAMLISGSTILRSTLTPHEHPFWFIAFWFVCGWLTITAMLLALFDLLMIRAEARKAAKALRTEVGARTADSLGEPEDK